jgi:predicted amidohydrolase YtcJ
MSTLVLAAAAAADLILVGGRIHTMDEARPEAAALAVRGGRVVAVGTDAEIRALAGSDTRVVDLAGRAVLPGLIDTHTHAFDAMRNRVAGSVDLGIPGVRSLAEAVEAVRRRAAEGPAGSWILGDRWDESKWPEARYLRRTDIDAATGPRPTYLEHISGHAAVANGAALRVAGVTRDTPDPVGGSIERDPRGEPTGVLKDTAMALVASTIPASTFGERDRIETAARVSREAAAVGLTTVHDSALTAEALRGYQEAEAAGRLQIRVLANPLIPADGADEALGHLRALGLHTGHGSEHLKWGAVKFFTDGGMAARTIAVTPPGPVGEPSNLGLLRWDTEKLAAAKGEAHALGWQITAHAIGDRAIAQTLDAIEKGLGPNPGDHRTRIVHCGVTTPALLDRIKALGVLVDHNPPFVYWIGAWFRNYGPERAESAYRGRSYETRGIVASGGSDFSVTALSPWWGIWAAVERKEYGTGAVLGPDERVDPRTALRWYTLNGAYAGFEERDKGTLTVGKRADLIVLDRDPLAIPIETLKDVRVLATMVGGVVVHQDIALAWPAPRD